MAKHLNDAGFDKENKKNDAHTELDTELDTEFGFPSEFPYEFDSFGTEPVESMAGSTETESSDGEDFLAGLTRRLSHASIHETRKQLGVPFRNSDKAEEKTRGIAGSPQSTLSGVGSWSCRSSGSGDGSPNGSTRVPSPTTTPFPAGNDEWDVLYAAAGQVARLKINKEAAMFDFQNRGLLGGIPPPIVAENSTVPFFANQNVSQVQYQHMVKQQCGSSVWGRQVKANWSTHQVQNKARDFGYDYESVKCARTLPRSAWHHSHQVNHRVPLGGSGSRPVLQSGTGVKRGCGGTGVFLPRQYGAPSPQESRKKTSCAPVVLPAKVIHALTLNINELSAATQPRFSNDFGVDYDALLARRNALLMQQRLSMRREEAASYEIRLPQEWTY